MEWKNISITAKAFKQAKDLAYSNPKEICGIMNGNKKTLLVNEFIEIPNVSELNQTVDYLMSPNDLMKQLYETTFIDKTKEKDWLLIVHSHPNGLAFPSIIDLNRAEYDVIYMIIAPTEDKTRCFGFNKRANNFYEITYKIVK